MSYETKHGISGFAESTKWNWLLNSGPTLPVGGLGCASCGGGCSDNTGLGQASGPGLFGTGLFASFNPSTWGAGEWITVGIAGFAAFQLLSQHPKTKGRAAQGSSGLTSLLLFGVPVGLWWFLTNYNVTPNTAGVGDYQAQGYLNPQILSSPTRNSQVRIPAGW